MVYAEPIVYWNLNEISGNTVADTAGTLVVPAQKRAVAVATDPPVDLEEGRALATGMCLTCHQLHGTGQDVGPDLTGVGRSSLDALLANIIDPDQIIGLGYELVTAKTNDGRTIAGRLVAENDASVTLALPDGAPAPTDLLGGEAAVAVAEQQREIVGSAIGHRQVEIMALQHPGAI